VRPSGNRILCSVTDTGVGIAEDQFEKIFEPFYTTKGDLGTGLGLPVVREIVTSYAATVKITSTVGSGTTFTFDLPV